MQLPRNIEGDNRGSGEQLVTKLEMVASRRLEMKMTRKRRSGIRKIRHEMQCLAYERVIRKKKRGRIRGTAS